MRKRSKIRPLPDRIEIGDGQRPGDHRARARAAARADRDAALLGPFDEVGDDQEIARKAHADDHADLVIEPLEIGLPLGLAEVGDRGEARLQARQRILAKLLGLGVQVAGDARQDRLALRRAERAAPGDDGGVVDRLGQVGEQLAHRHRRLDPGLGRGAEPVVALDVARLGDAQHRVVRGVEFGLGISGGVGRDQRQIVRVGEVDQRGLGRLLDRIAAAAELDIEPAREQGLQAFEHGSGGRLLALGGEPCQRALPASGQRDQAFGAAVERVERDVRKLLDRAVEMRRRDQRAQIAIAGLVLRVERQPVDHGALPSPAPGRAMPSKVPTIGCTPFLDAGVAERHRAVEAVAVGHRRGGEIEPLRLLRDRLRLHRPFEHRVAGEEAKRDVGGGGHCPTMEARSGPGKAFAAIRPQ